MTAPVLPQPLRTAGIVVTWVLAAVALLAIAAGAWIGVRAASAYGQLRAAEADIRSAVDALKNDPARAAELVQAISTETAAAHALTSDPVWAAAEGLPWIGPQLGAFSTIAAAADEVAGSALTPLSTTASGLSLDALRPVDGAIDTTLIASLSTPARTGADGIARAAASVASLDRDALLGPVRTAVDRVSALLDESVSATDALARATRLLPAMLGADGPRDYLLVFQNNAEWRSLGGIVGAMVLVHTEDGRMQLTAHASASELGRFDDVMPIDDQLQKIYGTKPGNWMQNVTQVPDFSLTGRLARDMWQRKTGLEVDGVIAMDPIALSYVLEATGPVALPSGDLLASDNAVQLLLNDVYKRFAEPKDQDAFFTLAASSVFDALSSGAFDPPKLFSALDRAAHERRLLIWSADEAEESLLVGTTLAGALPETTSDTARMGVYLNDGTGSKMDYYVKAAPRIAWDTCSLDAQGRATGTTTLTLVLTNTAPTDAATSLPAYITGGGAYVKPAGLARTVAYVYLPEGYDLTNATVTGDNGYGGGFHEGRQVLSLSVDLDPGESVTAVVTVRSPRPAASTVVVEMTPTIDAGLPTSFAATCGAQ